LIIPPCDFLAVSYEAGLSRNISIKTASVLQKRHAEHQLPTGRQVRRRFDQTNRAYGQLSKFIIIKPELAPVDSAVYLITDIVQFVEFTCAIQSRPVKTLRHLKLSGDAGQESLKFSLQLLFDDSHVLQDNAEEKEDAVDDAIVGEGA